ncbi:MAG: hypothetical protein SGI86_18140 [Deltaproteobacteria bacterium]|nr:hypothetical protein [Deltaproteobacteria bacterium]
MKLDRLRQPGGTERAHAAPPTTCRRLGCVGVMAIASGSAMSQYSQLGLRSSAIVLEPRLLLAEDLVPANGLASGVPASRIPG